MRFINTLFISDDVCSIYRNCGYARASNAHVRRGHTSFALRCYGDASSLLQLRRKGRVSTLFDQQKQFVSPELGPKKIVSLEAEKLRADISVGYCLERIMGCGGSKGGTTPPPHGQPVPRGTAGEVLHYYSAFYRA